MVIYIVLYTILLLVALFETNEAPLLKKKIVLGALVIVFTLFRGLRWNTGTDWEQFYEVFVFADWDSIFTFQRYGESVLEFGYVFLNVLIKSAGGNYTAFLLITNLLILSCYAKFTVAISNRPILVFAVILFTTSFFPVRLNIAAALLLLSYLQILNGSPVKFLLLVALAATIHTSSLIFLPFYFLSKVYISRTHSLLIFLFVVLASNNSFQQMLLQFLATKMSFLGSMVALRFEAYMDFEIHANFKNSLLSNTLVLLFILLFTFIRTNYGYKDSAIFNMCFNSFLLYFLLSELFKSSMEQLVRTSNYFMAGFPVLVSVAISELSIKKELRGVVYTLFVAYMYYKLYVSLTFKYPELHIPYRSVIEL